LLFPLFPSPTFPSQRRKARHTPHFSSFLFVPLRTLSFSVSCNSFVCHSYENTGGIPQLFPFWNSPLAAHSSNTVDVQTCGHSDDPSAVPLPPYPLMPYLLSFHTLPHSFALLKISTRFVSSDFTLFHKNTRGWVGALLPSRASRRGGNLCVSRELLSECGRPRLESQKRNGTDIDVCPTNREWCCVRQLRLDWKRDCHSLVGQVIYG
jgi:hypothetical protein